MDNMPKNDRNNILLLEDDELLKQCRQDKFRGSGRGGQKRNVTDSAVRLTHIDSEISAESDKTRSQHDNRRIALKMLRKEIALRWREEPPAPENIPEQPGRNNSLYPIWVAAVLDILKAENWQVSSAAKYCGLSTNRLVKILAEDKKLWKTVNENRQKAGMKTLNA